MRNLDRGTRNADRGSRNASSIPRRLPMQPRSTRDGFFLVPPRKTPRRQTPNTSTGTRETRGLGARDRIHEGAARLVVVLGGTDRVFSMASIERARAASRSTSFYAGSRRARTTFTHARLQHARVVSAPLRLDQPLPHLLSLLPLPTTPCHVAPSCGSRSSRSSRSCWLHPRATRREYGELRRSPRSRRTAGPAALGASTALLDRRKGNLR